MTWKWDSSQITLDTTRATLDGYRRFIYGSGQPLVDVFSVNDSLPQQRLRNYAIRDALVMGPDAATQVFINEYLGDPIGVADLLTASLAHARALLEPITVIDVETKGSMVSLRSIFDALITLDVEADSIARCRSFVEAIQTSDLQYAQMGLVRVLPDPIIVQDSFAKLFKLCRAVSEAIGASDLQRAAYALARVLSEGLNVADLSHQDVGQLRTLVEFLAVGDIGSFSASRGRALADQILLADINGVMPVRARALLEAILATDAPLALYIPFVFAGVNPASPIIIGVR